MTSLRQSGTSAGAAGGERAEVTRSAADGVHADAVAEQRAARRGGASGRPRPPRCAPCPPVSRRTRRTSSSVSDDLPDPPVPVIPSTGTRRDAAAARSSRRWCSASRPSSRQVMARASAPCSPAGEPGERRRRPGRDRRRTRRSSRSPSRRDRDAARPRGRRSCSRPWRGAARSPTPTITPPPPPKTLTCAGARRAQGLDQVAEVLDVAALVGADRHALRRPPAPRR